MDKLLEQMAAQSPGIVASILIVLLFLKHLQKVGEATNQMFKEIHREHIDSRQQSREALRENALSTKENTMALAKLSQAVEQIKFKSGL